MSRTTAREERTSGRPAAPGQSTTKEETENWQLWSSFSAGANEEKESRGIK